MNSLSRSIARLYLVNIVVLFIVVGCLIVAVDVVINLDRFSDRAAELWPGMGSLEHSFRTASLIADLWGPRLVQLFLYLNGIVLIAAAGFTCSTLVASRELIAMLAAGISLHRAALPILAVGLCFILLGAAVQETVVPRVAHLLIREPSEAGSDNPRAFAVRMAPDAQRRTWYARSFDGRTELLTELTVWERSDTGELARTITARSARWDGTGWILSEGTARTPSVGGAPAGPPVPVDRLDSSLDPAQLKIRHLEGFAATLSWRQAAQLLARPGIDDRTIERLELSRWGRVSGWASSFFALTGAVSLMMLRVPRPMLGPALKAAPVALLGFAATALAGSAAIPGLPVWLGAFVPAAVVLSLAITLFSGIET